ncbi:MAG: hypothetical protein SF028_09570 [Candidatus Sumerlaeia bacterium]|nr:hypothetical protein [Candidatus Sumerlaeia bacterium]
MSQLSAVVLLLLLIVFVLVVLAVLVGLVNSLNRLTSELSQRVSRLEMRGEGTPPMTGRPPKSLAEVHSLVREGKRAEAIKSFRELTGCGFDEAKAVVDLIERPPDEA